jgi:hypothetical protein
MDEGRGVERFEFRTGAEVALRTAQQDRAASLREYGPIGRNQIIDQSIVDQIMRRFRQRHHADLAVDLMQDLGHFLSLRRLRGCRSRADCIRTDGDWRFLEIPARCTEQTGLRFSAQFARHCRHARCFEVPITMSKAAKCS